MLRFGKPILSLSFLLKNLLSLASFQQIIEGKCQSTHCSVLATVTLF